MPLSVYSLASYSVQRLTPSVSSFRFRYLCKRNLLLVTVFYLCQVRYIALFTRNCVPQSYTTHSPRHRVSALSNLLRSFFHRPGLTAVNHRTSDTAIANLRFQLMRCSTQCQYQSELTKLFTTTTNTSSRGIFSTTANFNYISKITKLLDNIQASTDFQQLLLL